MSTASKTLPQHSQQVSAKKISGQVLQRLRSGQGLVQEEMADRLGKARSSLAGWEAGRGGLNLENLLAFLDQLGVTMEDFGRHFDALRRDLQDPSREGARATGATTSGASSRSAATDGPATRLQESLVRALRQGALSGKAADTGAPVVLQAQQAVVLLVGEQGLESAPVATAEDESLQPWVRDLFKRAERLFPAAEEVAEAGSAQSAAGARDTEPFPEKVASGGRS